MGDFYDQLARWQPFFSAVAGATATLAGLLFVSLSINRDRICAPENHALLRLARRSFGDFLSAMFIALMFLVPANHDYILAISLGCVTAIKVALLCVAAFDPKKKILANASRGQLLREYTVQLITCAALVFVIVEMCLGHVLATYVLVPLISLLLYNAVANAWLLLLLEIRGGKTGP